MNSEKQLRDELIRLAHTNPGPLQDEILNLLEKHAAPGNYKPHAQIEDYGIYIWMTFAGYGRVHHLTGNAKKAEGLLEKYGTDLRNVVNASNRMSKQYDDIIPLWLDQSDIIVNPLHGSRDMIAYLKFGGKLGEDEKAQAEAALSQAGVRSIKPMPRMA